jgi:predicted PurR-regulated permease PerM
MSIIALSLWNINFALIIGVSAGLANLIPYVGPSIGLIFASIVALIQYQDITVLLKIVPSFLIIQFLDNNIVQPLVVGNNVNLSPVTMIFAMLAAAQVFGFLGIVLAVPVAAIIKTVFLILLKKYKEAASAY